jgi:low temperature requirement protein LtrA
VLALVWWAWGGYAWLTNAIHLGEPLVRVAFLGAAFGSFFVALGVPGAYGPQSEWFVVPYFAVRVLHVALYMYGLRADRLHQAAIRKLAPWFLVAPAIALVGGFLDDPARVALWGLALAIDLLGALLVAGAGFRVSSSHFAERYGLFIIIALGESIVAIGVGAVAVPRDAAFAGAVAISFVGVVALWWAYFDFIAGAIERALRRARPEARAVLARDMLSYFHYPIVLGIIFYAVAAKKTVEHPLDPLSDGGRFALGGGIAFFMLGFVLGRYRALRVVAWERVGCGAAAAVTVVLAADLAAAALLAIVVALVAIAVAFESRRLREVRRSLSHAGA